MPMSKQSLILTQQIAMVLAFLFHFENESGIVLARGQKVKLFRVGDRSQISSLLIKMLG